MEKSVLERVHEILGHLIASARQVSGSTPALRQAEQLHQELGETIQQPVEPPAEPPAETPQEAQVPVSA